MVKYGKVKREHGRVRGLDEILDTIVRDCPHITRIVPGRIKVRRGKGPSKLTVQYATPAGVKCIYTISGTVQEVFMVSGNDEGAIAWLQAWIIQNKLGG